MGKPNRRGHHSSGSGSPKSKKSTSKNRGPRHGHGNRGKGGGNAYGTNNINMTIGQAKQRYAKHLADGRHTLEQLMKMNPAETVSFHDLLDDQGDTKQSNLNTPNNSTNNNTMTLTADQTKLNELYQKNFGRDAGFGQTGGADYWLSTHTPTTQADWDNIDRMLAGSDEGQKHRGEVEGYTAGNVYIGGIDPSKSIASQSRPGFWGDHFRADSGSSLANMNAAGAAQAIADYIGHTPSEAYFNNSVGGGGGGDDGGGSSTLPTQPAQGWWNQFADANAFKDFLFGDQQQDDGMGDFMKFMMLMSIMRPQGGGYGGGYGGSQYGYGGLNPGGVQAAYDPLQHLQGMGNWFKTNFGSGGGSGGATTSTVNAT